MSDVGPGTTHKLLEARTDQHHMHHQPNRTATSSLMSDVPSSPYLPEFDYITRDQIKLRTYLIGRWHARYGDISHVNLTYSLHVLSLLCCTLHPATCSSPAIFCSGVSIGLYQQHSLSISLACHRDIQSVKKINLTGREYKHIAKQIWFQYFTFNKKF